MGKQKLIIRMTIRGLTDTAIEKICVMGKEEAAEDIAILRAMVEELVYFWGLEERYINKFDMDIDIGD